MTLTLEQQLEFFDRNFDKAWARMLHDLRDPVYKAQRRAGARQRLIDNYPKFGDSGFHKSHAELVIEENQEYEDGPNYRLMRMQQGWPT